MVGFVNRAFITGRVGRDPDIRKTRSGDSIANLSVATSESWRDKRTGEKVEKTEWHRISVFNPQLVGVVEKYVRKGSLLHVEGKVQTRKWTDRQDIERMTTEVVLQGFDCTLTLLGDPPGGKAASDTKRGGSTGQELDDEIPFAPEWR